jgi:hypothetical protein
MWQAPADDPRNHEPRYMLIGGNLLVRFAARDVAGPDTNLGSIMWVNRLHQGNGLM